MVELFLFSGANVHIFFIIAKAGGEHRGKIYSHAEKPLIIGLCVDDSMVIILRPKIFSLYRLKAVSFNTLFSIFAKNIPQSKVYDVIIIGAGAAGLMAAGVAAERGKKVLLLEKMEKAGRKIRISGKGRCNLTNARPAEEFLSKVRTNADFFLPSFKDFSNQSTIRFFKKIGLELVTERGDRVFPASGKAWDVADALVRWAQDEGVEIQYHTRAVEIRTVVGRVCGVKIINKKGFPRNIESENVILCTGGVSYPATGSTGDGYLFAHQLGHRIEEVRPSLVPLVTGSSLARSIVGVQLRNVNARLVIDGQIVREEFGEMEFTSRGLEGAVILRLSRDAVDALIEGGTVKVVLDLKSALSEDVLQARISREREALEPSAGFGELLRKLLPKPLVAPLARELGISVSAPQKDIMPEQVDALIHLLKNLTFDISDYRPFDEAIVTAGGVAVEEVDAATLQSKHIQGLYFAGEVLDLDADTGGYNLQIAFSTGHLAGKLKK